MEVNFVLKFCLLCKFLLVVAYRSPAEHLVNLLVGVFCIEGCLVAGLVRLEKLLFSGESPALLHHIVSKKPLKEIRSLTSLIEVQCSVYFAFDVLCELFHAVFQLLVVLCRSVKKSLEAPHLLNFPNYLLEALVVSYLPVVLFLESFESILGIVEQAARLNECVFKDL